MSVTPGGDADRHRTVSVAPAGGAPGVLSYCVPPHFYRSPSVGMRVLVPLGSRIVTGYVVGDGGDFSGPLKDVLDILDDEPLFNEASLSFYRFISDYYCAPLGDVIRIALPAGINVESKRRVRAIADKKDVTDFERIIVDRCKKKGGVLLSSLIREYPDRSVRHLVDTLVRKNVLEIKDELDDAAVSPGSVRTAVCIPKVADSVWEEKLSRAPKAREVYLAIRDAGEVRIPELNERFGDVSGQVRLLCERGLIEVEHRFHPRSVPRASLEPGRVVELSPDQERALEAIGEDIDAGLFSVNLLFGVTGSGKTEVYIRAMERALAKGLGALILVPEISLTPQLAVRIEDRFPGRTAMLHSGLSRGERLDQWERIRRGEARVVVGARSALFAPLSDIGLIVVDEEHDSSYKQNETPRYHARDSAVMLGKLRSVPVILGSATPSLESWHNADTKRYRRIVLPDRVTGEGVLPAVEIVDMRTSPLVTPGLSVRLMELLTDAMESSAQAILLLNRRGFSTFILCPTCGHRFRCPSCSITLTYHKKRRRLLCHYCDFSIRAPDECPECRENKLLLMGAGTERVAEEVSELLPDARILRLDRDSVSRKGEMEKTLSAFSKGDGDILLGTQMVAKGHDFPRVTLVGVINADTGLNLPDFRSAERSFSLLTQAAGRAGRGDAPARVVIQTYNPEHPALAAAMGHDYEGFAHGELQSRRELGYPPFSRLVMLRITGVQEGEVKKTARSLADRLNTRASELRLPVAVLGPVPAPIERIRGRIRYQLLLKGESSRAVFGMVADILGERPTRRRGGVQITVDIDPLDML
ncbi:MAG: primosomal protein N' [Deltaproteobacteria bacterium]|nr:primosomal protein N' [Candidatus Zymogenaceae bacterium]